MDDFTPRPKASQAVAAHKRARQADDQPSNDAPIRVQRMPLAIGALMVVLLMIGMTSYQLASGPTALQIPTPTRAPAQVFETAPSASPALPAATIAPTVDTFTPVPTTAVPVAPPEPPPQTGQGLTSVDLAPVVVEQQSIVEPSYIENVGQQAPHSPRGGLCGPNSGDCAPGVPFGIDSSQYIQNVGAQAPHKVR